MKDLPEQLQDSSSQALLEAYDAFYRIEMRYDELEDRIHEDREFVSEVKSSIETVLEERIEKDGYHGEDLEDLLGEERTETEFDPMDKTMYWLENGFTDGADDFLDKWLAYESFLDSWRQTRYT